MGVWNSNDFLTWILYKFRITFWMILYNLTLLIYFSLQFLKLDFISLQTQFLYNFWKLFSLSLQFLKLAFISLQFLKLTFISLQFLFLYDSDATLPYFSFSCPFINILSCSIRELNTFFYQIFKDNKSSVVQYRKEWLLKMQQNKLVQQVWPKFPNHQW